MYYWKSAIRTWIVLLVLSLNVYAERSDGKISRLKVTGSEIANTYSVSWENAGGLFLQEKQPNMPWTTINSATSGKMDFTDVPNGRYQYQLVLEVCSPDYCMHQIQALVDIIINDQQEKPNSPTVINFIGLSEPEIHYDDDGILNGEHYDSFGTIEIYEVEVNYNDSGWLNESITTKNTLYDTPAQPLPFPIFDGINPLPLGSGKYQYRVRACNAGGCDDYSKVATVYVGNAIPPTDSDPDEELPPDPKDVAPTLNPTQIVNMKDSVEFLFTGDNPIQTGVSADDIVAKRVAVVRGQVLNKDNTPLSGVTITIKDHTEYGQTLSRADGWFDMAVNGGGYVTINYAKKGYLPVQRQINTPWRDYIMPENVVMISLDPQVTTIDLTSSQEIQVAQGSIQTDADGDRQATLFFPKGTSAAIVMPDGSIQPLTTLNVRATEYTVGENGQKSMPGELPFFSGYTYAVELSVDEALSSGASKVEFNQEIPFYVDNFLEFPVGEVVPAGWYDYTLSSWIPSKNGRIIKLLDVVDGLAVLDVDGNGEVADQSSLLELGITNEERKQLAKTFTIGKTLWRSPITHFTPWDCNWPFGPPEDAIPPIEIDLTDFTPDPDEADECSGCIIEAQSQTLGEEVPIVGTSLKLHYRSDRAGDNKKGKTLEIPLIGADVPPSLIGILLTIDVAGKQYQYNFPPLADQIFEFEWDGSDAYDRSLNNAIAKITIGYTYPATYYSGKTSFENSFGNVADSQQSIGFQKSSTDRTITINKYLTKQLIEKTLLLNIAKLGAWTLNNHHSYDLLNKILYLGDGNKKSASLLNNNVFTKHLDLMELPEFIDTSQRLNEYAFTPNGDVYISLVNNTYRKFSIIKVSSNGVYSTVLSEISVPTSSIEGIAATNNGVYYSDHNFQVIHIDNDGNSSVFAGNGVGCIKNSYTGRLSYQGNNGPATEACVGGIQSLAFSKDGTLFIAGNAGIQKVSPDGIISRVAGNGLTGSVERDKLALQVNLSNVPAIFVDNDDVIYFASSSITGGSEIFKIGTDGVIRSVVGGGTFNLESGVAASNVSIPYLPRSLAVNSKGEIYFSRSYDIFKVNTNGIVFDFAGTNPSRSPHQWSNIIYNELAINMANGFIEGIACDPQDNLYVSHSNRKYKTISKIASESLLQLESDEVMAISPNGKEIYLFNDKGRHLKTFDSTTNAEMFNFTYSEEGYLNLITDINNRVTTIERDSNGQVTAIISPDEQITQLQLDNLGYLSEVTDPEGNSISFIYDEIGLMKQRTDGRGNKNNFIYNQKGLLVSDSDPLNGGWTLNREGGAQNKNYIVTMTSGENRSHTFSVDTLQTGEQQLTKVAPDGSSILKLNDRTGKKVNTFSNGNISIKELGPDPRFGMMSPKQKSFNMTTPGGLSKVMSSEYSVSLNDPNDLFNFSELINHHTLNGNIYQKKYLSANRSWVSTSPEGRLSTRKLDEKGRLIETYINSLSSTNFIYNAEGRISNITRSNGVESRESNLSYYGLGAQQGFLESITDAANRITNFSYDNIGRLLTKTLPNGNNIHFHYDANGNVTSISPANNETHTLNYTQVNKISDYTPPVVTENNQLTTQYSYNLDKQLELISLPDGQEVNHVYHATKEHRVQTKIPRGNFDYAYSNSSGLIEEITAPDGGVTVFTYDGDLLLGAELTGTISGKVTQSYNNDFQVIQRCVNTSDCINFNYDNDLLLTQAGDLSMTRAIQKGGLITGTSLGNIETTQTFNDFSELLSFGINDSTTYLLSYTRDELGRITQKVETIQGTTITLDFDYDLLGQLSTIKTNGVLTSSYDFDNNGNRTHVNGVEVASFDAQDRLMQYVTNDGVNQYTYSDNGDLKSKTNTSSNKTNLYHYDVLGNLISAAITDENSSMTTQVEYIIDGQNRRVGKKVNGSLIQGYLYKDQLNPIAELDGNGSVVSRFIYGSKAFVPDYMVKDGKTYRILSDHIGSPRLVINTSDKTIAQRIDYDVWGNIILNTNPGFQPFAFGGGLYDQHTNLTRFGARDYDAGIGRWTTKDPIGLNGGLNVYGYVGGDPVNIVDPEGLDFISFGYNIGVHAGDAGGNISESIAIGTDENGEMQVCLVTTTCARVGPGLSTSSGVKTTFNTGNLKEGNSLSGGAFAQAGPVSCSLKTTGQDSSLAFTFGGTGGSAGGESCISHTKCF